MSDHERWVQFACASLGRSRQLVPSIRISALAAREADEMMAEYHRRYDVLTAEGGCGSQSKTENRE